MPFFLRRIWDPARYQGGSVSRRYYEGWYFKQADVQGHRVFAVIPGVSFSEDGSSSHAFVQVVTNVGKPHYFSYPIESFAVDASRPFNVTIGESTFSQEGMVLRLRKGNTEVKGEIRFGPWMPWPVRALSPGVMGWYRFVPRMETYHGVLSLGHETSGTIALDGETICLDGGRGYAEKDWGHSFPRSWIWAQSNHFERPGVSFSLSVAKVPWMTGSFVGSIAGLMIDGTLHRFTTYTGAHIFSLVTGTNEAHLVLRDRHAELEVGIHGGMPVALKSPLLGVMDGHDAESLDGTVDVAMRALKGGRPTLLFQGTGMLAGVEVMDKREELSSIT